MSPTTAAYLTETSLSCATRTEDDRRAVHDSQHYLARLFAYHGMDYANPGQRLRHGIRLRMEHADLRFHGPSGVRSRRVLWSGARCRSRISRSSWLKRRFDG
jgi:hypothetical protein